MVDDLDYLHIEWHLGRVRREQLLKHKSFDFLTLPTGIDILYLSDSPQTHLIFLVY